MAGRTLILIALVALLIGAGFVSYDAVFSPVGLATDEASSIDRAGDGTEFVARGSPTGTDDEYDPTTAVSQEDPRSVLLPEPAGTSERRSGSRPTIEIVGRIVDRAGAAVEGAEISVSIGPAYYERPRSTDADLTSALGSLSREIEKPARTVKSSRPAKPTLRTGTDGRFAIRTPAYRQTRLEITACHTGFAPTRVQDYWSEGDRTVQVGDVVLETGGTAMGSVVDDDRHPIEGAVVRFVPVPETLVASNRDDANVKSNSAPSGIVDLVPPARTGADGNFELQHLPPGPFVLLVDKPRHLPAVSIPRVMESDATIACGKLVLVLGTAIAGRVLDRSGRPLRDVAIEARLFETVDDDARRRAYGRRSREARPLRSAPARKGTTVRETRNREVDDPQPMLRSLAIQALRRTVQSDEKGGFLHEGLPAESLRFTFRHENFIDEERGPVAPKKTSTLEVRMYPRLAIEGRLVSQVHGRPVEQFGVVARRIAVERPRPTAITQKPKPKRAEKRDAKVRKKTAKQKAKRSTKPAKRAGSRFAESPKVRAKRLARQAAIRDRELARQRKEQKQRDEQLAIERIRQEQLAYARDRLGPTGQVPQSRPRPAPHDDGKFRLEGLQPGTYVLDIVAPGHVKMAAGPFELARGQRPLQLTLHAVHGVTFAGKVLDRKSGKPIAGAHVELRLPPLQISSLTSSKSVQSRVRYLRTDLRVDRARSRRDGSFSMLGLRPGLFQFVVRAQNYREYVEPALAISSRPQTERTVRLDRGASVRGMVTGRVAGEQYSVALISSKGTTQARVDPGNGRYEVTTLEPDEYYTLVRRSGAQDSRREKVELSARRKRGFHDLVAYENSRLVHDIDANATALGALRGRVYHNGREAPGFGVQLVPQDAPKKPSAKRYSRSTQLRATADAKAAFTFAYFEPGNYVLEVTPSRKGGRRSRGPWHREPIVVRAGQTLDRRVQVRTGDLRFRILNALTGLPVPSARIELVSAAEAGNRTPKEWRRLSSTRRVSVRDGSAVIRDLMPGRCVYMVFGSGLASEPLRVSVEVGEVSVIVRVGPKTKKKPKSRKGPDKKKRGS